MNHGLSGGYVILTNTLEDKQRINKNKNYEEYD